MPRRPNRPRSPESEYEPIMMAPHPRYLQSQPQQPQQQQIPQPQGQRQQRQANPSPEQREWGMQSNNQRLATEKRIHEWLERNEASNNESGNTSSPSNDEDPKPATAPQPEKPKRTLPQLIPKYVDASPLPRHTTLYTGPIASSETLPSPIQHQPDQAPKSRGAYLRSGESDEQLMFAMSGSDLQVSGNATAAAKGRRRESPGGGVSLSGVSGIRAPTARAVVDVAGLAAQKPRLNLGPWRPAGGEEVVEKGVDLSPAAEKKVNVQGKADGKGKAEGKGKANEKGKASGKGKGTGA